MTMRQYNEPTNELQIIITEEQCSNPSHIHFADKLFSLEEEQESLYSSIFSLTTYIARIQLHLNQIISAPVEEREILLKSLQEFAFQGIKREEVNDINNLIVSINLHRKQQRIYINLLKSQLRELKVNTVRNIIRLGNEGKQLRLNETKTKDTNHNLIKQLKNKIVDLENFISYLQEERDNFYKNESSKAELRKETCNIFCKLSMLLKMFATITLERGFNCVKNKSFNLTTNRYNWSKIKKQLDTAIQLIKRILNNNNKNECNEFINYNLRLTKAVRKYLATSIRDLMQHGATMPVYKSNLMPLINYCFYLTSASDNNIHSWEIVLAYYRLKRGDEQNSATAKKLCESYNLDIGSVSQLQNKQDMLYMIGNIISSHSSYKRSHDSHFKAFVCAGLNANKLVLWLNSIFQCNKIIESHYYSWSYAVKTKFQDSLQSLDGLTGCKFNLPVDFAVHKYQNIVDVFS